MLQCTSMSKGPMKSFHWSATITTVIPYYKIQLYPGNWPPDNWHFFWVSVVQRCTDTIRGSVKFPYNWHFCWLTVVQRRCQLSGDNYIRKQSFIVCIWLIGGIGVSLYAIFLFQVWWWSIFEVFSNYRFAVLTLWANLLSGIALPVVFNWRLWTTNFFTFLQFLILSFSIQFNIEMLEWVTETISCIACDSPSARFW